MIGELGRELASRRSALDQRVERQVRCARPVAAGELQLLDAETGSGVEQPVERQLAQTVRDHADLHACLSNCSPASAQAAVRCAKTILA